MAYSKGVAIKATGKNIDEWLDILEKSDACKLSHKEIAQWLVEKHELSAGGHKALLYNMKWL